MKEKKSKKKWRKGKAEERKKERKRKMRERKRKRERKRGEAMIVRDGGRGRDWKDWEKQSQRKTKREKGRSREYVPDPAVRRRAGDVGEGREAVSRRGRWGLEARQATTVIAWGFGVAVLVNRTDARWGFCNFVWFFILNFRSDLWFGLGLIEIELD